MSKRKSRETGSRKSSGSSQRQTDSFTNAGAEGPGLDDVLLSPDEDRDLLEFEGGPRGRASIKVVGVGGGGGNAVNTMIDSGLAGVDFIAANTDSQALQHNNAGLKLQLGNAVTRGLGCGADPDKGRTAAAEVRDRIREVLEGTDMVFVTAGLGGGTGTGAAPIVAEVARELGALTVGVVTKPFLFEGRVRMKHAERGLDDLHRVVDTVITIPNQRLLALAGKNTSIRDAFSLADAVLFNAVRGISDLITIHGLINLDFADVRTIMNEMGAALMGTGCACGEERGVEAARAAISSPLLEDLSIDGARGVLINITGGASLSLFEVNEASTLIQEAAHEDANIIFGAVIDESMEEDEIRVTVIATGLNHDRVHRVRDHDARPESLGNVTPLRRESPAASGTPSAAEQRSGVEASVRTEPGVAPRPPFEADALDDPFISPFPEDELDVPTFIRRGSSGDVEEEDAEKPAFLRRSAD